MRISLPILIICLFAISLSSTVYAQEWGEISEAEWQMGPPADYPESGAVVIFDIGQAVTELGGLEFTRHMRVKIFNSEGLEKVKDLVIEYYHYDKLRDVKAHILRPDGTVIEVKKDAVTTVKKGYLRETKISFSAAAPGDIFECTYSLDYYGGQDLLGPETYFLFSQEKSYSQYKAREEGSGQNVDSGMDRLISNLPSWYFDHSVYCLLSRYTAQLGAGIDYCYYTTNVPPERAEPEMERVRALTATAYKKHIWTMENLPPFVFDSTVLYDGATQRCALHFRLFSTVGQNSIIGGVYSNEHWRYVGESFQGYIDEYSKTSRAMKETVKSLTSGAADTRRKIEALYKYVTEEFNVDSAGYIMRPRHDNMKKLYNEKVGRPFELNLLLVEMLKEAGLQAWPILITTRSKVSFTNSGTFDHMLTLVDIESGQILMDASARGCPVGSVPVICLSKEGVLVDYSSSRLVTLAADECPGAELKR